VKFLPVDLDLIRGAGARAEVEIRRDFSVAVRVLANFDRFCYIFGNRRFVMATMNVSLPDPMKDWVEERVKSGHYSNASDYVRDLIRRDQEKRDALIRALVEAEQGGISPRSVQQIIAETKTKLKNGEL
jgi:antitoxin ParD1/3/4